MTPGTRTRPRKRGFAVSERETMTEEDTIVATATPRGRSARGIVRLSGPQAVEIVSSCLERPLRAATYTRVEARLRLGGTGAFPVALYVMLAPRSYTREDVVEIHAPGSPPLLGAILSELTARGARPAEAGEFTRRAFMNGRIDLAQAEAVMALVRAGSEREERLALSALTGDFSREVAPLRRGLLRLLADVEAALDFVEDAMVFATPQRQRAEIERASHAIEELLRVSAARRVQREETVAVLYGPANAGKSSIFNLLAGSRSAIVEDAPGTTRDFLEAAVELEGVQFLLVDTAGIRPPAEFIEEIALERSESAVRGAQLVIFVADASSPPDEAARRLHDNVRSLPLIPVLNKCDRAAAPAVEAWKRIFAPARAIELSALTGGGLDELELAMAGEVLGGGVDLSGSRYLLEERQKGCLQDALEALSRAAQAVRDGQGDELAAFDLREAVTALGRVTGEDYLADLLDEVFSRFCVGK